MAGIVRVVSPTFHFFVAAPKSCSPVMGKLTWRVLLTSAITSPVTSVISVGSKEFGFRELL